MKSIKIAAPTKEEILALLSFITAFYSSYLMTYHQKEINFHCVLFGSISEKKRIFTEGNISLCFLYFLTEYSLVVFGLCLWYKERKYPASHWVHSKLQKVLWRILLSYLIIIHVTMAIGLRNVCNTLDAPRCSLLQYIEWSYFTPKYFNGEHFFHYYMWMLVSSTLNVLSLLLFYFLGRKCEPFYINTVLY